MLEILLLKKCWKNSILFLSFWQKSTHIKKNLYTVLCTRYYCTIDSDMHIIQSMHVDLQNTFKYQTSYYKISDKYRKEICPSRCTISLIVKIWHPDILITTSVSAGGHRSPNSQCFLWIIQFLTYLGKF